MGIIFNRKSLDIFDINLNVSRLFFVPDSFIVYKNAYGKYIVIRNELKKGKSILFVHKIRQSLIKNMEE